MISQATTPLAVSVDVGGTVTFRNSIPARTVLLGVTLATLPLPTLPPPPVPGLPQAPGAGGIPAPPDTSPTTPGAPTVGGTPTAGATYTDATVGEQIMPSAGGPLVLGVPNGFEDRRRTGSSSGAAGMTGASGTGVGGYDGAQAPIPGVLGGLDAAPSTRDVVPVAAAQHAPVPDVLGTPAILAVLLLSMVSAGLVRTTMLSRRTKKVGAHSAG